MSIPQAWRSRAAAEASVGAYVAETARDLRAFGAVNAVLSLADRMIADEARHARTCVEIASRLSGEAITLPTMRPYRDPLIDRPVGIRATLRVVALSCISESIATVWVDAATEAIAEPWLRDLQRKHLADEVFHARLGWAHLGSRVVDDALRAELSIALPTLLRASLTSWLSFDESWPSEGHPEVGLPSHADTARWVREAVETLVLPGLEHVGVDVSTARVHDDASWAPVIARTRPEQPGDSSPASSSSARP